MKKYHYSDEVNQFGPFAIEELKDKNISRDTMVWYQGLENWVKASEIDELKELLNSTPPPLNSDKQMPPPLNRVAEPKSNLMENNIKNNKSKTWPTILKFGVIVAITLIGIFIFNEYNKNGGNSYDSNPYNSSSEEMFTESGQQQISEESLPVKKTEEELKRELAMTECSSPRKYLKMSDKSITGIYKNLLSMKYNGFKVKFNIQNSATIMTFKNVKCKVTLTSNSGSIILSKKFTVNEFVTAGNYVTYKGEFECTNQEFKDTDSYSFEILGAECH